MRRNERTADETHFAAPDRSHFSLRREPFEPGERLLSGRFSRFRHALLGTLDSHSQARPIFFGISAARRDLSAHQFSARSVIYTWECSLVSLSLSGVKVMVLAGTF
ncbi:hypothetical protein L596_009408 [Steinernema carpocapsae]|uniref:Uncharacterized protein n=1 Tax=Steinernema carpocapsae TaxID=34508 RepID=A0A4U5PG25_STECR|nr:hypothetical protein L596_009408 [Steinernema carpocapsae]